MSTFVGRTAKAKPAAAEPERVQPARQQADKTRAELVEEAEELGIDVPKNATKKQLQKLIDEAPVM